MVSTAPLILIFELCTLALSDTRVTFYQSVLSTAVHNQPNPGNYIDLTVRLCQEDLVFRGVKALLCQEVMSTGAATTAFHVWFSSGWNNVHQKQKSD